MQLIYFAVEAADADVLGGEPLFAGEQCVGVTTSGAYGHYVRKSLGFGYVLPQLAKPDASLEVALLGERCRVQVLTEAAHDPANHRLRA